MAFRLARRLAAEGGITQALGGWARSASGYRQLGLVAEDLIMEDLPGVQEAISRLSQEDKDKRYFRIKRAMHLSMKHTTLPQDQWITDATDVKYLSPLIEQVERELNEQAVYDHQA